MGEHIKSRQDEIYQMRHRKISKKQVGTEDSVGEEQKSSKISRPQHKSHVPAGEIQIHHSIQHSGHSTSHPHAHSSSHSSNLHTGSHASGSHTPSTHGGGHGTSHGAHSGSHQSQTHPNSSHPQHRTAQRQSSHQNH